MCFSFESHALILPFDRILLFSPFFPLLSRHFPSPHIILTYIVTSFKYRMSAEQDSDISDVLTNLSLPKTSATLTLRIIKSFEYRTEKSLVLHNINLETTNIGELKELARDGTTLIFFSIHRKLNFAEAKEPNSYSNAARMEAIPYHHFRWVPETSCTSSRSYSDPMAFTAQIP